MYRYIWTVSEEKAPETRIVVYPKSVILTDIEAKSITALGKYGRTLIFSIGYFLPYIPNYILLTSVQYFIEELNMLIEYMF